MIADWFSKKRRQAFLSAFVRQSITMQIQLLRKREPWSQKKLGELAGKKQNAIARLEDPSYGKFTITTLLELANAFDVALSVKFVPFSELEKQTKNLSPDALCVARFLDEVPAEATATARPVSDSERIRETASTMILPRIKNVANQRISIRPGV